MNKKLVFVSIGLFIAGTAAASDDERYSVGTAATAGASTQVLASSGLDYVTGSTGSDTPSQTILKRALVGAATGATATTMAYQPKTNIQPKNVSNDTAIEALTDTASAERGKKGKKHKKGHRPPGWDKGKKTGWGDSDVPPGLAKKD
jgi:hypothetical protein